jgi:hypothetical protein
MIRNSIMVLATLALVWSPTQVEGACETDFINRTEVTWNNLRITFAVDKHAYAQGDSVRSFLCIENLGAVPFSFYSEDRPQNAFRVYADSCLSDPVIPVCGPVYFFPFLRLFSPLTTTIQPSQSRSWTLPWGGSSNHGNVIPPDVYRVVAGLRNYEGDDDPIQVPPGGASLWITLAGTSGVPVFPATWGGVKARHRDW